MGSSRSPHGENPDELSEGLLELRQVPPRDQAMYWRNVAESLKPSELQSCMAEARLDYDILGRYFDGTSMGINFIAERVAAQMLQYEQSEEANRSSWTPAFLSGGSGATFVSSALADAAKQKVSVDEVGLDTRAIARIIVSHFGYMQDQDWQEAAKNDKLLEFCGKLGAGADSRATSASLRYAVRRLRIGSLLTQGASQDRLYHYDYSPSHISGSFVSRMSRNDPKREPMPIPRQRALVDCEGSGGSSPVDEYLFVEPGMWPGNVHWVHAHRPAKDLLLALGQQHHLRVHAQGVICRLEMAHPQHNFGHQAPREPGETVVNSSPDWFLIVFPAATLDQSSQRSLQRHRRWFNQKANEARLGQVVDQLVPPPVDIGVVMQNMALLWSGEDGSNTVISVASAAEYLGKWTNATDQPDEAVETASTICCCRRRMRNAYGYEPLATDEEEANVNDAKAAQREFKRSESPVLGLLNLQSIAAEAEQTATFEYIFRDILLQLGEENSMLRMGTHVQLASRILLQATSEYADVVDLYGIAIARMECMLAEKDHPDKEELIAKISAARLELGTLLRNLEPFVEYVMPDFRTHINEATSQRDQSSVIRLHHLLDIENNLRQCLQECRAQIHLCESVIAEYDRKSGDKVNNILNFLTTITFLVMPIQILTGVYGMNFKVMPELGWKYAYPWYFLLLSFVGTVMFATQLMFVYRSVT